MDTTKRGQLQKYAAVLRDFVEDRVDAAHFEREFLDIHGDDPTIWGPEIHPILEDLFVAVDAYCPDPALRDERDIDEDQLKVRCAVALDRFSRLLGE